MNQTENLVKKITYEKNTVFLSCCLCVHAVLSVIFFLHHTYLMTSLNILSLFIYVILITPRLIRLEATPMIAYYEILIYGVAASILLGTQAGFFLYPLGMIAVIGFMTNHNYKKQLFHQLLGAIVLLSGIIIANQPSIWIEDIRSAADDYSYHLLILNIIIVIAVVIFYTTLSTKELLISYEQLESASKTDELTGIYNRNYFQELSNSFSEQELSKFVIMMIDIDNFKRINDGYGRDMGDICLKYIGNTIGKCVRTNDILIRWDGDKFLFMLRDCPYEKGLELAEKIRKTIALSPFTMEQGGLYVTVSIGVTSKHSGEALEKCISRAEKNLYESKRSGKNKVMG